MSHLSVLCDKLTVPQLVKKFPAFCATRRFIALFIEHPVIAPTNYTMFIHYVHFGKCVRPSGGCNAVTRRRVCTQIPAYKRHTHTHTHVVTNGTSVDSPWIGRACCVADGLAGPPAATLEVLYPLHGQTGARVLCVVTTMHSLHMLYIIECEGS